MKGERVAQLELILRGHPEGLRKSDIARRIGVHRSTIGRYIEDLKQYRNIYEDKNLIKIVPNADDEPLALSVYESLALNMGVEMILNNSEFRTPHLASGLRKIAVGMQSYAPKVSANIMSLADQIESDASTQNPLQNEILEVLIDAWVSGRIVRILHQHPDPTDHTTLIDEETELAPYFIGFIDTDTGRNPVTVTGRLRHTSEIITLDISHIKEVTILNEIYTIPDNLRVFKKAEAPDSTSLVVDTIPLTLLVRQKSALNSFSTLTHGEIQITKQDDGTLICHFEAENSIELYLRIIQCGDAVKILAPTKFREKFVTFLQSILSQYQSVNK